MSADRTGFLQTDRVSADKTLSAHTHRASVERPDCLQTRQVIYIQDSRPSHRTRYAKTGEVICRQDMRSLDSAGCLQTGHGVCRQDMSSSDLCGVSATRMGTQQIGRAVSLQLEKILSTDKTGSPLIRQEA
jgi:hypothetical protein